MPKPSSRQLRRFALRKRAGSRHRNVRVPASTIGGDPYQDGKTRIFLDDERPCPVGWKLARNIVEFQAALDACEPGSLAEISFDWYLGSGVVNGAEASRSFIRQLLADPARYSALTRVNYHSSDRREAGKMAYTMDTAIEDHSDLQNILITHCDAAHLMRGR